MNKIAATDYRSQILAIAEATFKPAMLPAEPDVFVNLFTNSRGTLLSECHKDLDEAATDAFDAPGGWTYHGTIHLSEAGRLRLLDLSHHGEELKAEEEEDERLERRYINGLMCGAGRSVL